MVDRKRVLERTLASERTGALVRIVSCGIILANFVVCSSSTLEGFAPLSITVIWLYAVSLICGFALGIILDELKAIFYGVFLMALIAVLIFSSVLVLAALLSNTPFLDIVLLLAFQRSFPRFLFICVLGYVGACLSVLLKLFSGRY